MLPRIDQPITKLTVRALQNLGPMTAYQLAELMGITIRNMRPYLQLLHAKRIVFIQDYYHPKRGPKVPIWAFNKYNDPDDEPRPLPLDPKRRARQYRYRKRLRSAHES